MRQKYGITNHFLFRWIERVEHVRMDEYRAIAHRWRISPDDEIGLLELMEHLGRDLEGDRQRILGLFGDEIKKSSGTNIQVEYAGCYLIFAGCHAITVRPRLSGPSWKTLKIQKRQKKRAQRQIEERSCAMMHHKDRKLWPDT